MQKIQTFSITAPGFYGLNTQDSSLDLASGYALVANNCVIDKYGRVGARNGWVKAHATLAALGANDVQAIGELIDENGTSYVICAGNNKLFKLSGGVLSELTYGGGGVAPVITANNWQMATLGNDIYLFQRGFDPLEFAPSWSTTQYRRISEEPGYVATAPQANVCISAYGRLWVCDTPTDKVTITFTDIKNPMKYSGGSAGTLNVSNVWPNGGDTIVGLAAHNGFLFIFGKNNILVYDSVTNTTTKSFDPATMFLKDVVSGIGCIARDSIQVTGDDVIFLSRTGVRSVMRTIQEKSAPLRDLSRNVRSDVVSAAAGESESAIKSVYSQKDAFYLITFPTLKTAYCFDLKAPLENGAARATTWTNIEPKSLCAKLDGTILIGKPGYIGIYSTYLDDTATYRYQYYTNHSDLGEPLVTSILKRISVVIIGGSTPAFVIKWGYDFSGNYASEVKAIVNDAVSEYGVGKYGIAEYSTGVLLQTVISHSTGSGKVIQAGFETDINGSPLSIQKIEILAKNGKIV